MGPRHDQDDPTRQGWLVFHDDALLGAGDSVPAAREDVYDRSKTVVASVPIDTEVRPCTLAEIDNALTMLTTGPDVGLLSRHDFEVDDIRYFRIGGRNAPVATTADVIPPIGITWNPGQTAAGDPHGQPRYPRCPDCSATAMRDTDVGANPPVLECAGCGSLFRPRNLRPAPTPAPKPGPESAAILRREAAEACASAARMLRDQTDDKQAQILIVDAEIAVKKMRAAIALAAIAVARHD